jgi:hypothetical protein
MFDLLLPFLDEAMRNSKRLYNTYSEKVPLAKRDPATVVFRLFDELFDNIRH